jgi:hypothetical protein
MRIDHTVVATLLLTAAVAEARLQGQDPSAITQGRDLEWDELDSKAFFNPTFSDTFIYCPQRSGACTKEYLPILCGPKNCKYDNACYAKLNGFDTNDCKDEVPPPGEGISSPNNINEASCPEPNDPAISCLFDPKNPPRADEEVTCGECTYATECFALAAGFSPQACGICPEPDDPAISCFYDPENLPGPEEEVTCGKCSYPTECFALAAGFSLVDCDVGQGGSPSTGDLNEGRCPEPNNAATSCPFDPKNPAGPEEEVTCGDCKYPTECFALAAGFSPVDCGVAEEEPLRPECPYIEGTCTEEYYPVSCGPDQCFYENTCWAELNGFNTAQDCMFLDFPAVDPNCPYVEGVCTMEYQPVTCGEHNCSYGNACVAELNGFNVTTECTFDVVAPLCSDMEGDCNEDYYPVSCGPAQCIYNNTCWAESNGFNVTLDCMFLDFPAQDPSSKLPSGCPMVEDGVCKWNNSTKVRVQCRETRRTSHNIE